MAYTYTFYIHGMHCKACSLFINDTLSGVPGVESVKVNEQKHTVDVRVDKESNPNDLAESLTSYVNQNGYSLSVEKRAHNIVWKDFLIALPIAFVFIAFFIILQKVGLINLVQSDTVSYPVAFLIGIIASLSSCLAIVGGLLLSVSASFAKSDKHKTPQIMFHVGRLIAFFILGGVIGLIGSAFTLSITTTVILSILIGLVMLILGINLLDIFPWAKRFQLSIPQGISDRTKKIYRIEHSWAPFLIGVSTFFLPCGFTQSMQFYTLSTGSFITGALTMFVYALGTLPVLALISFTSFKLGQGRKSSIFFKTAGVLVILFALLNIVNSLAIMGIIKPIVGF